MLNQDFRDILCEFAAESVDYMVVGAYALAAHGRPRATGDIDLWVRPETANAQRALRALARFGAPIADVGEQDLRTPGTVVQFGVAPCRIDILTAIDGVEFEEAWAGRMSIEIDGLTVPVISREHLLRNKQATGRPKDRADAAMLRRRSVAKRASLPLPRRGRGR